MAGIYPRLKPGVNHNIMFPTWRCFRRFCRVMPAVWGGVGRCGAVWCGCVGRLAVEGVDGDFDFGVGDVVGDYFADVFEGVGGGEL